MCLEYGVQPASFCCRHYTENWIFVGDGFLKGKLPPIKNKFEN